MLQLLMLSYVALYFSFHSAYSFSGHANTWDRIFHHRRGWITNPRSVSHPLLFSTCTSQGAATFDNRNVVELDDESLQVLSWIDRQFQTKTSNNDTTSEWDKNKAMARIDLEHVKDTQSTLYDYAAESSIPVRPLLDYQKVYVNRQDADPYFLAIESLQPLWNASTLEYIRNQASQYWQKQKENGSSNSRFTIQRPGNYEAHVSDLKNAQITELVNNALQEQLYPLIRQEYSHLLTTSNTGDRSNTDSSNSSLQLCVYDALFIRYNATEAYHHQLQERQDQIMQQLRNETNIAVGAGQPLHKDLGLVSVNVMLNDGFSGGGTFLENQLLSSSSSSTSNKEIPDSKQKYASRDKAILPSRPGCFLAHSSAERHAGARTYMQVNDSDDNNVRDILVMFITAWDPPVPSAQDLMIIPPQPLLLRTARLKQCRTYCNDQAANKGSVDSITRSILCRIFHQRLAVDCTPTDGEAWQYLGTSLMDYYNHAVESGAPEIITNTALQAAIVCFTQAAALTPCDARVYNNWGIMLGKSNNAKSSRDAVEVFEKALQLLVRSETFGCDVESDTNMIRLNYGLRLSKLDQYHDAMKVLEPVVQRYTHTGNSVDSDPYIANCQTLYQHCHDSVV